MFKSKYTKKMNYQKKMKEADKIWIEYFILIFTAFVAPFEICE